MAALNLIAFPNGVFLMIKSLMLGKRCCCLFWWYC